VTVTVPAQYNSLVNSAASQLGIPVAVVAAQINTESGFNPNAQSPAGAQGIAQFEPGTWASYGSGSPFNAIASFAAYVKYMSSLLRQENGNVRDALAAYNAGPGNLTAGYGYADSILSQAGQSQSLSSGASGSAPVSAGSTGTPDNPSADIGAGFAAGLTGVMGPLVKLLIWGFETLVGASLMIGGVFIMMQGSDKVKSLEGTAVKDTAEAAAPELAPEEAEAEAALKSSTQARKTANLTSSRVKAETRRDKT
jgi:hypothetical protein